MNRQTVHTISSVTLLVLLTLAFAWVIRPYFGAVLWAVILAILFHPLHRRFLSVTRGRRNAASALSLLAVMLVVLIPGSIILSSLSAQAAGLYRQVTAQQIDLSAALNSLQNALPSIVTETFASLNLTPFQQIQTQINAFIGQLSQLIATQLLTIGQNTMQLVIASGVMLYVLFFMFREGEALSHRLRRASPLNPDYTDYLATKFVDVVRATVQGNVIIAMVQGTIGGVTFWLLGLASPLLWGVVMAVLALLPFLGATLVWAPVAVYLQATGSYLKGVILLAVGAFLIATIDNLLRPPLVGRGSRLPDYIVLLSTLGGIATLGVNGLVMGPLIAALFIAAWSRFTQERDAQPGPVTR
ncbi:MAG: AI-2E family transporter [Paracoccus sp. (in: a-proteobacteria)]|uniref:AI-2E family transporter n=1 Tax=Paracoccus sp. TaxID=267 RepID=UPI0026E095A4|nr:AI-2E family transporter [Paracoccus sp. (in: a-proteobacteria)]MDO5630347.1 AI-2E family transporter [Paracoccus sp. (in: a-proteobacteria)]